MDLGLRGRVAIVGGASKGLGRASAERLAAEGARVAICARDEATLKRAAEEIRATTGAELLPIKADLAKPEDIERAVSQATATLGPIAIAVCNLGGPPVVPFDKLADSHWQQTFDLTFMSVVRLMRAVLPQMRTAKWGRLLAIQSSSIKQPVAGLHLSNGVRPGVAGLFKTSVEELAKHNITANVVLPGMYLTDRIIASQRALAERTGRTLEQCLDALAATIPMRRFGKPEELGDMIAFLASERASYITGAVFQVDGGMIRSVI